MFTAKRFSFNHIPCEQYGLRIYDIDGNNNEAAPFVSTGKLLTDVIPSKGRNYLYGRAYEEPLEFTLVFGVDPEKVLNMNDHLDRYEMGVIANWLTGHETYQWLEIEQSDLEMVRYRCVISELEPIHVAWLPWAFKAKVTCDSPYAYMFPKKYRYSCTDVSHIELISRSTINKLYYPKMTILCNDCKTVSILNETCNEELSFSNLPVGDLVITIDNELGKIESSDPTYPNLYQYCNFNWLPLKKGKNKMVVTGNCNLEFVCEFPLNIGG